jgi:hypothetical protein
MFKNLEDYLEEIGHFLSDRSERQQILAEIRSHIMEKASGKGESANEGSIAKIIEEFGQPHAVARNYLEESHIILPTYRRFLFLYTWLLFAIHFGMKSISFFFDSSFSLTPFDPLISIKRWTELLSEFPLTWIFDFGLVGLTLYFISQNPQRPHLFWPKILKRKFSSVSVRKNEKWKLGVLLFLLMSLLVIYVNWGTLFFSRISYKTQPIQLLQPEISKVLSLAVLALVVMEIISWVLRARFKALWVDLANNAIYLAFFSWALNLPKQKIFLEPTHVALTGILTWTIAVIIFLLFIDSIKILRSVMQTNPINKNND